MSDQAPKFAMQPWVEQDVCRAITPLLPQPSDWPSWMVAFRAACLKSRVAFEAGQAKTHLIAVLANGGDVARQSCLVALIKCARLGMSPDPALQHFALIPYGNLIDGQPMYRGWLHLITTEPSVEWVDADVVYRGEFDPKGLLIDPVTKAVNYSPNPIARDSMKDEDIVGAWCSIKLRGRERLETTFLSRKEILKRKAANKGASPAWNSWFQQMCLAKVIKACCTTGRIPLSQHVRNRIVEDEREEILAAEVQVTKTVAPEPPKLAAPVQDGAQLHFDLTNEDPLPDDAKRRERYLLCLDQEALAQGLSNEQQAELVGKAVPGWNGSYETLTAKQAEDAYDAIRNNKGEIR